MPFEQSPLVGCSALPFSPELNVFPDSHAASTPTGLNVDVTIPQSTTLSASGVAEADVKETELVFPEGLEANAGAADGLAACKVENVGFEGAQQWRIEGAARRNHRPPALHPRGGGMPGSVAGG